MHCHGITQPLLATWNIIARSRANDHQRTSSNEPFTMVILSGQRIAESIAAVSSQQQLENADPRSEGSILRLASTRVL
jgi:hypothetical protein